MKKQAILISLGFALIFVSCDKKENEGNKSVIKSEVTETTFRYIATDGSAALVTYTNDNGDESVAVKSNKTTIKAMLDKDSIYRKDDIEIKAKNDSLYIKQGDNIIELRKAGGQ